MNRRDALKLLAATLPLHPALAVPGGPSRKKGCCGGEKKAHQTFGAHWYYTWWTGGNDNPDIEFVPMIKGSREIARGALKQARRLPMKHLLGYNEPEREDQGHLSVDDALKFWPELQAVAGEKNVPLGSPAPSSDTAGVRWLEAFMEGVARQKLRVDFIAVHWYRGRDADALEKFLKGLARTYRRPVWLTEFNGWSGGERENREFLGKALRFLEREKRIERYAYFDPGKGRAHSLYQADGSLSKMGELYRDAGG